MHDMDALRQQPNKYGKIDLITKTCIYDLY